jgi:SP family myo-inositol transporter-like MFS transporter 13
MMTQADVDGIDEHEESAVILDDFIIGAFILGNLVSASLIYKVGRKKIMLFSLPITLVSLLILAYTMRESNYGDENDQSDELKQAYRHMERMFFIIVIVIYTLSVSIGLSTTVLGITAEILPSYLLSTGSSLTQSFGWVFNFLINTFFLDILDDQ